MQSFMLYNISKKKKKKKKKTKKEVSMTCIFT